MKDTYVILVKRRRSQYCPVSRVVGRKQADARILLLQAKRPDTYLLFNLRTKTIEDGTTESETRDNGGKGGS